MAAPRPAPTSHGAQMWYETLPAMGLIIGAITVTGVGMGAVQRFFNGGKVRVRGGPARMCLLLLNISI